MAELRKIADERDARACLSAVAGSKEPLRAWARRHGIDGRSLRAWHINLSARSAARPGTSTPEIVELVPASMTGASPRYVVRIGDASIEVGDDFDAVTLRRIVEVLRAC